MAERFSQPHDPYIQDRTTRQRTPQPQAAEDPKGTFHFVTWRLADSIPQDYLHQWQAERKQWLRTHPKPWDETTAEDYRTRFPKRLERWLDKSYGACHLRNPYCADFVRRAMRASDGEHYTLATYVIMPNHVHTLVHLPHGEDLESIVQEWKSYSTRKINGLLYRKDPLWHTENWDHVLHNTAQLQRCREYIAQNPVTADLREDEFLHYVSPVFIPEC